MKKTYIAGMLAIVFLSACSEAGEKNNSELTYQENSVTVAESSPILSKIRIETVGTEPFSNEFRTVGTVQAQNGHYAEVGVPFDGRIIGSKVRLGSRVAAGQPLFEMSSSEFLEAGKLYFQNQRNYEKAKADYERKKSLAGSGIVSQRELDEAFTEAENAKQEKDCAEAVIKMYGMDPASIQPGQAQTIVAPISGEVVRNNCTPGAYVKADSEPVITIAELSRVWVTAQVKERFIGSVCKGASAEIFTEAEPDVPISGEVIYVGSLVDEQTRSVEVTVSCNNPDAKLKHGMYVSVHFMGEVKESVMVPTTAVFQGDNSNYVYVASDKDNVFERRNVTTGASNDGKTKILVTGGLTPGEKIIAEGGLYLNN